MVCQVVCMHGESTHETRGSQRQRGILQRQRQRQRPCPTSCRYLSICWWRTKHVTCVQVCFEEVKGTSMMYGVGYLRTLLRRCILCTVPPTSYLPPPTEDPTFPVAPHHTAPHRTTPRHAAAPSPHRTHRMPFTVIAAHRHVGEGDG